MGVYAVVLGGGSGQRMGGKENKVFLSLRSIPAIVRAIVPFSALCEGVVIVARRDEVEDMEKVLERFGLKRLVLSVCAGGEDRQASVAQGLKNLPRDADVVLIHDGARALVTEQVIQNVIDSVLENGSGVAAVPVSDTIKRADKEGRVEETLLRENLFAMQTPQGFRTADLRRAHEKAEKEGYRATDDAALLEYAGMQVHLCRGDGENIKLTTPMDRALAEMILQNREEREGR